MSPTPNEPGALPQHGPLEPHEPDEAPGATEDDQRKKKKKKKEKDGLGTNRGIETMFRTSYMTHVELSSLADSKANIMISINGLIMSIVIGGISSKIDMNPQLLWPTTVLLIGCLVSMVFAVLAARPRVSSRVVDLTSVRENRANILFFGNFVNMSEADYVQGMTELMQNTDSLYYNMIRDIYGLGQVLALKFRMLRIAYAAFMVGLLVGVILFIIVYVGIVVFAPPVAPAPAPAMP